jgi:signal transduction histidine kinase/CheY-like chemotaxis protein/NO-binding membrane sensor protein with MHYT domain
MQITYNYYLVALSYFIAAYASYAMLSISERLIKSKSKTKWLLGGSVSLASGIWSMHFIGMLAYEMNMPVTYELGLTIFSGIIVLAAAALAMYLIGWHQLTTKRIVLGGTIIGLGIAAMHYIGMAAMIMPARISYDPFLFIMSILIAITASIAAMWIAHYLASSNSKHHNTLIFIASLIMGIAIAGMHYVGMESASYTPINAISIATDTLDNLILISTITLITLLIITSALFASKNKSETHLNDTVLLVLTIMTAVTISVGVTIDILYNTTFKTTQAQLVRSIEENRDLIRAITKFDQLHSQKAHVKGARAATIAQVQSAHSDHNVHSQSGEFFLFEYNDDNQAIRFLIKETESRDIFPDTIPTSSYAAQVFRKALSGNSGITKIAHPISKKHMLAAYAYLPELNAGILNSISIDEIRKPYFHALTYTSIISFFVIVISAIITIRINTPIINALQEKIASHNKTENELRNLTNNLESIVKERTIELKQALIIAEDAAKSKGEFLANMSHEIRTPMNGVLGMLQLLAETTLNRDQKDFVKTAHNSAETLLTLLNDILDFSKIEAGAIEIESIDFSLQEAIEDVAALLAESAHKKELELLTLIATNIPYMIKGDPTRIRQILFNLISNAIKFTEKGEILISVKLEKLEDKNCDIRIEVSDTGIGISESNQGKIFEVFKQEDGTTTRRFGGTGLGLAIAKKLTQCMGGDLNVRSSVGAGSTFYFSIKTEISNIKSVDARNYDELRQTRVLIVDDNDTNRKILESILASWNINFSSTDSGQGALDLMQKQEDQKPPYDLILIDMMMPGMNGLEVTRKLRQDNIQTKVIMLTSLTNANIQEESKLNGINACIHKPIKKSLLLDTIMATLHDEIFQNSTSATSPAPIQKHEVDAILVAEDNKINQKVVTSMLKNLGYPFQVANNGQEAVDAFETGKFSLVLMDCQMPIMDGFLATEQLRKNNKTKDITIIAMTANAMEGDRERCITAGMDDYISKPINKASLAETLKKWLNDTTNITG